LVDYTKPIRVHHHHARHVLGPALKSNLVLPVICTATSSEGQARSGPARLCWPRGIQLESCEGLRRLRRRRRIRALREKTSILRD
jgi:hypothetical protein